jgi:hypothetical protein
VTRRAPIVENLLAALDRRGILRVRGQCDRGHQQREHAPARLALASDSARKRARDAFRRSSHDRLSYTRMGGAITHE